MPDSQWKTKREQIRELLELPNTQVDLKQLLLQFQYPSKNELLLDLESLFKTLKKEGKKITISPAQCIGCGYLFKNKAEELTIPSKCPKCKSERIQWPKIQLL